MVKNGNFTFLLLEMFAELPLTKTEKTSVCTRKRCSKRPENLHI